MKLLIERVIKSLSIINFSSKNYFSLSRIQITLQKIVNLHNIFYFFFPNREIYLRANGRVKFLIIPTWFQVISIILLLSIIFWVIFSSAQYLLHSEIISAKNNKINQLRVSYTKLDNEFKNTKKNFIKTTLELESKHKHLVYLVAQKNKLEIELNKITEDLTLFKQKHNKDSEKNKQAKSKIEKEKLALANEIINLKGEVDLERNYSKKLENQLYYKKEQVKTISRENEKFKNSAENLANQIIELSENIERLRYDQQYFVEKVMDRTDNDLNSLETIIKMTGLNLEKIISKNSNELGGPLLPLDWQLEDHGGKADKTAKNFQKTVLLMEEKLIKWESLHMLLKRIPITAPVKSYYVSSPYGRRKDPFTNKWSFHSGIDLGGTKGQTVLAPAPGKVSSVSKTGPYGKMVEIDHGFNIRTRYGHLKKILVKRGEMVEFRDKIGKVGNTGRSTGSHLHYEVWYGNKVLDPGKFLKAGKYVFKD